MSIKATSSVTIADISDGTDGTGISTTTVEYQAGSSGTSKPTGTWSTSIPPTSASSPYLWTRVTYTYSDGRDPVYVYSVGSTPEIEIGGRNLYYTYDYASRKYEAVSSKSVSNGEFTLVASGSDLYIGEVLGTGVSWDPINSPLMNIEGASFVTFSVSNPLFTKNYYNFLDANKKGLSGFTSVPYTSKTISVPSNAVYLSMRFGYGSAVSGTTYKVKIKVEKGTQATDWTPAPEDVEAATNEAAKTATNFMKYDGGLTIGKLTDSTLGANVFIDSDSVDIRNGTNVLASYGENVNIKNSLIVNDNGVHIQGDDRVLRITNNDTTNMVDTMINDHTIVIVDTDINPLYSVELSTRTPLPGLTFNYGKSSEFKLTNTNMSFGSDNQFTIGDSSKRLKNIYTSNINLASHLTVGSTSKIDMWEDGEGGNIRLWAPDSCGNFWDVDAYNENLRFYTYDVNGTYQGCTISRGTGRIDKADKAWGVADYNNTNSTIKIGWAGDSLTTTNHFAAYGQDSSGTRVIKDISVASAKSVLGINTIQNTIAPLESWSYLYCKSTTNTSYGVNSYFHLNVASNTFYTSGASGVYSKGDDANIYLAKSGTYLCLAKVCISGTKDSARVKRLRGVFAGSECANSGLARLQSWESINTSFLLPISSAGYLTLQFQDESGSGTVYISELQIFKIK